MSQLPPLRRVSSQELRRLFNASDYWTRAQTGEFRQRTLQDRHPAAPRAPVPHCTRGMIIAYYDQTGEEAKQ